MPSIDAASKDFEEEVVEKVETLRETMGRRFLDTPGGTVFAWRLPRGRRQGSSRGPKVFLTLSSGDRVLVGELQANPSAPGQESHLRAYFDLAAQLLDRVTSGETSMERTRGDLTSTELAALAEGGVHLEKTSADPSALLSTLEAWHALTRESYTTTEAARLMGVQGSRVRQRLGGFHPSLYGFRSGKTWLIPKFQIENRGPVRGLGVVLGRLDSNLHPLSVTRWFQSPNSDLLDPVDEGRALSPIDWLKAGGAPDVVAELASSL